MTDDMMEAFDAMWDALGDPAVLAAVPEAAREAWDTMLREQTEVAVWTAYDCIGKAARREAAGAPDADAWCMVEATLRAGQALRGAWGFAGVARMAAAQVAKITSRSQ